MGKEVKQIAKEAGKKAIKEVTTTGLRWMLTRLFRRKSQKSEVPEEVAERFKFFLSQFEGLLSYTAYSFNVFNLLNDLVVNVEGFKEKIKYLKKDYENGVVKEVSESKSCLENFEKYREKEWFRKATEHFENALENCVRFVRENFDNALLQTKPEHLSKKMELLDRHYSAIREYFNHLVQDYLRFALNFSCYVFISSLRDKSYNSAFVDKFYLPEVPSKKCLMELLAKLSFVPQH